MVAVAGGIVPMTDGTSYDQYALLRASEEALGIRRFSARRPARERHASRDALLDVAQLTFFTPWTGRPSARHWNSVIVGSTSS